MKPVKVEMQDSMQLSILGALRTMKDIVFSNDDPLILIIDLRSAEEAKKYPHANIILLRRQEEVGYHCPVKTDNVITWSRHGSKWKKALCRAIGRFDRKKK